MFPVAGPNKKSRSGYIHCGSTKPRQRNVSNETTLSRGTYSTCTCANIPCQNQQWKTLKQEWTVARNHLEALVIYLFSLANLMLFSTSLFLLIFSFQPLLHTATIELDMVEVIDYLVVKKQKLISFFQYFLAIFVWSAVLSSVFFNTIILWNH